MLYYPAPPLYLDSGCRSLMALGEVVDPGLLRWRRGRVGLDLAVDGDLFDASATENAMNRFRTLLGILRVWRPEEGELLEERRSGLGQGSVEDETGRQWIGLETLRVLSFPYSAVDEFPQKVRVALESSGNLRDALSLNGRTNRTGADFYMVHELAVREFGGSTGVLHALGISRKAQSRFTATANLLPPLEGGRHAEHKRQGKPGSLKALGEFATGLLRAWIMNRSRSSPAPPG